MCHVIKWEYIRFYFRRLYDDYESAAAIGQNHDRRTIRTEMAMWTVGSCMFSISAVGSLFPPVVTLYLALIFTAVARPKDAWDRREPPESVADRCPSSPPPLNLRAPGLFWIGDQTNKLDDDRTGCCCMHLMIAPCRFLVQASLSSKKLLPPSVK